jgi:hypothetical protein
MNLVVLKACVLAIWADDAMAREERSELLGLVETLASSSEERAEMHRLILRDLNQYALFEEIRELPEVNRFHVFDRCLKILGSDRKTGRQERRFMADLRRHCGISWLAFEKQLWRMPRYRYSLLIAAVATLTLITLLAVLGVPRLLPEVTVEMVGPSTQPGFDEIILAAATEVRPQLDSEQLYSQVQQSVVTIWVLVGGQKNKCGSGSIIGTDDKGKLYILTNKHVVFFERQKGIPLSFTVDLSSGAQVHAHLDFCSSKLDLALLEVPGISSLASPLSLRIDEELHVGQQVYALGSPIGLEQTFTSGVISALREDRIQTDTTVHSGSSGGPLLDDQGRICGVITESHPSKDISFAIYTRDVMAMLKERRQRR